MPAKHQGGARAPGCPPLETAGSNSKDEAPARDAAQGSNDPIADEPRQSRRAPYSEQALQAIEGERKAKDYLARLHARQAPSDDLAVTVSMLYGAALRGFCRILEKTLQEVPHG